MPIWHKLTTFWSLVLACGCLGLFGIVFSTISAQPSVPHSLAQHTLATGLDTQFNRASYPTRTPPWPDLFYDGRQRRHSVRCLARRKGPRSRAEVEAERKALWEKTQREIDGLVAEYHGLLPRDQAESIGAAYARYTSRYQDSIADQIRTLLKDAVQRRIFVPREYIFFDLAVRGFKNERHGLGQLRGLLSKKVVQVLLLFATNRLFRKVYRSLEFADQVVKELGIRCIYVKNGIDTADEHRWEMLLYSHGMIDQFVVTMYADNVRAAHEGLFEKRLVFGTLSTPVPAL